MIMMMKHLFLPFIIKLFIIIILHGNPFVSGENLYAGKVEVPVGIILNLDTLFGKLSKTCVSMAIEDFYNASATRDYATRIVPHFRDSSSDTVVAASAGKKLN